MTCLSLLTIERDTAAAIADLLARATRQNADPPADITLLFATSHHAAGLARLGSEILRNGLSRHVLGCTGESIVGENREVEGEPAIGLWSIRIPEIAVTPRRFSMNDRGIQGMGEPSPGADPPTWIVLGDPFSIPPDRFLKAAGDQQPGVRIFGGMASASQAPGGNRFTLDGEEFRDGAVGLEISGPVVLRGIVSQGCRPIGHPMVVTRAEQNIIRDLGRRPALEVLRELFETLDADDQERVREGLHIGRVINEYQETFQQGDFLVRNVMGADEAGGIAITDLIRVGQTVQFHVRDADTADEEFRGLLENERLARPSARVQGALLFSCNGRGSRLFTEPNHDIGLIQRQFGPIPVAGFFAMGELGPVGGQNFVHGFTASVVLFEARDEADKV